MLYGKAILHIKGGSASGNQLRSFSLRLAICWLQSYYQLPSDICTWRNPGNTCEVDEQIWINLDEVFRDAGFKLWPNVFHSLLMISDYPSSSGFGYAIPTRREKGVGSLVNLRKFDYNVCIFIFIPPLPNILLIESTLTRCTYSRWAWCHYPFSRHWKRRAWPSENPQDNCDWREQPVKH